ncbi:MAG TPA: retropepsin-like aspartic protease [Candidatus Baltobacteraceae bacterium]
MMAFPAAARAASHEWQPAELQPTRATLTDVLAALQAQLVPPGSALRERHEFYTYATPKARIPVTVAVKGADYLATVTLPDGTYRAGRLAGNRWRANANGISHFTLSDLQGDDVDRLPMSLFPFSLADCSLAGESQLPVPSWVIVDRPLLDKPHWFYVEKTRGVIVREITGEGQRNITIDFADFASVGGVLRPRHWKITGGNRADDLDVTLDSIVPGAVSAAEVAIPQQPSGFASDDGADVVRLPARFHRNAIVVDAQVDGQSVPLVLDSGTASITVSDAFARSIGRSPVLEHARIDEMRIGGVSKSNVSVLAIPLSGMTGILGYDFFFGHILHLDYEHKRVEVLTHAAGDTIFASATVAVLPADVDEGLPLVHGSFGNAQSDRLAIDTGSQQLCVLAPFVERYAAEIHEQWTPAVFPDSSGSHVASFVEGSIDLDAMSVSEFDFGPIRFTDVLAGVEGANDRSDALDIPFDGIIGTDELRHFDIWFDYDNHRIALRRNGLS